MLTRITCKVLILALLAWPSCKSSPFQPIAPWEVVLTLVVGVKT